MVPYLDYGYGYLSGKVRMKLGRARYVKDG